MPAKKKKKIEKNISDEVFKGTVDDFDRFEDFVSTNLYKIVVGAVVLVIGLIIGFIVYTQVKEANNEASVALSSAKTIKELNAAIKKYPNSKTDGAAKLNLGTLYFNDGKYQEALETYRALANSAPSGDIKGRAKLNTAYTLEAMKKPEQAAEKFSDIGLDASSPQYIRNEVNYSAGRIFVASSKPSRATSCLKAIKSDTPRDFWAEQAKRLLQRVTAKDPVPEEKPAKPLAVTPAPSPKTPAAGTQVKKQASDTKKAVNP